MSIINDHINLVYVKEESIEDILISSIHNPIPLNYAIITKDFNKASVLKYFPNIKFKYIENIDELYVKYVKYKSKYLKLKKQLGGTNISEMNNNYEKINKYFLEKDICSIEDISIYEMLILSKDTGATQGFGGGYLYSGRVEDIECVFKFLPIYETVKPDKNINEIGITYYISDYFLNHDNKKLTDNFVTFYHSKRCSDFLLQEYPLNSELREKVPEDLVNKDLNVMIVEKVHGDLKGYLEKILVIKTKTVSDEENAKIIKKLDSILFQIIYTLYIFNKEFDGFVHGDLHIGNILIKNEPLLKTKTYKIIRYYDSEKIEYNIEIETDMVAPKIWDFATSFVGKINKNIHEYDKYFTYKKDNNLIIYPHQVINKDLLFLLQSICTLGSTYHLPKEYIDELQELFRNNINKIFNVFLGRVSEKNGLTEYDYCFDDF